MTDERFNELMDNDNTELTADEIALGWHFCPEMDGLLMGPSCFDWEDATCFCGHVPERNTGQRGA